MMTMDSNKTDGKPRDIISERRRMNAIIDSVLDDYTKGKKKNAATKAR